MLLKRCPKGLCYLQFLLIRYLTRLTVVKVQTVSEDKPLPESVRLKRLNDERAARKAALRVRPRQAVPSSNLLGMWRNSYQFTVGIYLQAEKDLKARETEDRLAAEEARRLEANSCLGFAVPCPAKPTSSPLAHDCLKCLLDSHGGAMMNA